ncbi:MAG: hypothetical protein ACR2L1_03135 [Pyrinomonadaceae bacterium]
MKTPELTKNKFDVYRRHWLVSDIGVRDGFNSVFEIFSLIESRCATKDNLIKTFGIEYNYERKFLRSISNYEFTCQIELTRFLKYSHNHLINLRLEIVLFNKTPTHQKDFFNKNFISGFSLKAELAPNNQIVWKDGKTDTKGLTAMDISERMFSLLINQINQEKT